MKYIFSIILLIPLLSLGQTKEEPVFGLKFYATPDLTFGKYHNNLDLFKFSPAITISKNEGRFFEFGISELKLSTNSYNNIGQTSRMMPEGIYTQKHTSIGIYAEQNYRLFNSKNQKWEFYLGPRVGVSYWRMNFEPFGGYTASPNYNILNFDIGITPRVNYNVNNRISLDLSMPISYRTQQRFGNEFEPYGFITNSPVNYNEIISNITANLRLGINIKLFK
ncbi:MAG: hypothetical protein ACPGLV_08490 [Bacteroidia bacterium]